jgi:hypothetical protein
LSCLTEYFRCESYRLFGSPVPPRRSTRPRGIPTHTIPTFQRRWFILPQASDPVQRPLLVPPGGFSKGEPFDLAPSSSHEVLRPYSGTGLVSRKTVQFHLDTIPLRPF